MSTKQQVPVFAARLVEFQEEFFDLPTEDTQWAIMNGREAAKLVVAAIRNRPKDDFQGLILSISPVSTVFFVRDTTERFIAKDKFKVDTKKEAELKISHISLYFEEHFLAKVEEPATGSTMVGYKLEKDQGKNPILINLGKTEVVTTLTQLYAVIAAQSQGEKGSLSNEAINFFYIKDIHGKLRIVDVRWVINGWYIDASPIQKVLGESEGDQVFFPSYLNPEPA